MAQHFGLPSDEAGFENAQGILSAAYAKDPSDPQWAGDPGVKTYYDLLEKYVPEANRGDSIALYEYGAAQTGKRDNLDA